MYPNDRILIVDDNTDNLTILQEVLADEFTVQCAESGDEALRIAPQFMPNLVLLDVMMPGLSGNDLCDLLRAQPELRGMKVIMVSSLTEVRDRLASYSAGAVDYITKPFYNQEVLAKVRAWMSMATGEETQAIWSEIDALREAVGTALLKTVSLRDIETGEHLLRMRIYSSAIAAQLSLAGPYCSQCDRTFRAQLYRASPLHDVGKVGIADSILRKPGKLTPQEFDAMKRHAVIGEDILKHAAGGLPHSDYLTMAAQIARSHHERFDGTGYPDGLAGNDIPLAARIVAVADALDAMTSHRVYKTAVTIDEARQEIESCAGSHFDPVIVDALLQRLDIFKGLAHRLPTR